MTIDRPSSDDAERVADEERKLAVSLGIGFALAIFGIYILLAVPTKSYLQPVIIMSAIPFGIIGAIVGHWITGHAFSMMSVIGVIALSGVVVNDSLLLVDHINRALREGADHFTAVSEATSRRFRAIMLTSVTTFMGLAPMLLERSAHLDQSDMLAACRDGDHERLRLLARRRLQGFGVIERDLVQHDVGDDGIGIGDLELARSCNRHHGPGQQRGYLIDQDFGGGIAIFGFAGGQHRHKGLGKRPFGKQAPKQIGDAKGHIEGIGHGAGARQGVDVCHAIVKHQLKLCGPAHNDHGVKAVAAVHNIPAAARVNGVVAGGAHQNFFGLVVQFAKDDHWEEMYLG
mgnify:CR=1 FL=1